MLFNIERQRCPPISTAEMPTNIDGRDAPQYRQQRCSPISGRDALQYRSAPLSRPSACLFCPPRLAGGGLTRLPDPPPRSSAPTPGFGDSGSAGRRGHGQRQRHLLGAGGGGGLATPPRWPAPRSRALGAIIMTGVWLRRVAERRGHEQRQRHHLRCREAVVSRPLPAA